MAHERDNDANCNWSSRYSQQKVIAGLGNKKSREDHPNYNIIKISQNTKKDLEIWGDLLSIKKAYHMIP